MSTVILIGGPTACGKTTLTRLLGKKLPNSISFRRVDGFYELGKERGINNVFREISSKEVDEYFLKKCKREEVVLSDVHYAVQLSREKEFVPTISQELLENLRENEIEVIAIYLDCSPETCLERETIRFQNTGKPKRNSSLKEATLEQQSEKEKWEDLCSHDFVKGIQLNSELFLPEELGEIIIQEWKKKGKSFIKDRNDL